ncbi:MAG TPA: hypothetical protein PKW35_00425 [Nannocystaceae bacterium]|nr:hypothetical protein [Nannocystaceae bacterium]
MSRSITLGEFMLDALLPLRVAFVDAARFRMLLADLGWIDALEDLTDEVLAQGPLGEIAAGLGEIVGDAQALRDSLAAQDEAAEAGGASTALADPKVAEALLELALDAFRVLRGLATVKPNEAMVRWPSSLRDPKWWTDFAGTLPSYLLVRQLEIETPVVHAALSLLGVIEVRRPGDDERGGHPRVEWSQLVSLLTDPVRALDDIYQWKAGPFDLPRFQGALQLLARACALETTVDTDARLHAPLYQHLGRDGVVRVSALVGPATDARGFVFGIGARGAFSRTIPLGDVLSLAMTGELDATQMLVLEVSPGHVGVPAEAPSGRFGVKLEAKPSEPRTVVGRPGHTRVELLACSIGLELKSADRAPELCFSASVGGASAPGLRVVVALGGSDSFLSTTLGGEFQAEIGVSLAWSSRTGFVFGGTVALELDIPLAVRCGPLSLQALRARLGADTATGCLSASAGFDLSFELGPFQATVAGIGTVFSVMPAEQGRGALDALETDLAFKPPNGVGFAIDSETVKGGGFLSLDVEAGRYAGVLELVTPSFGLTALGILTTKIPGEPKGWSLFFALTASFNPGIQLGFGFVLTGVGGLFAVNRRLDEPAMRTAVRGGNLDSVLFPTDVVKEAPRIFATVESMFPIAKGSFVFGPMIKIGWGSPTLIEAMIGVFVSLPSPVIIALLGRVRLALPADKPILVLNMDIAGSINFGAGTVGLDAQIHDSTLFELELTGGMAFRARFKDQPGFLLSVGGFHPAFEPPADVGPLARMGMSMRLGEQENILITLRSYFALTSNTLQFGAGIDVSAQIMKFKIYGGAYFDALIVYRPFHFTAGMGAYFGVAWRKWELLAVRVALTLDGPGPWRARGEASFTIAGFELSFEFDETFGDKIAASEERAPVRAPLVEALAEPRNWGAEPSGFDSLRLRDLPTGTVDPTHIVIAPGDRMAFRQRVAPLNVTLEQMGSVEPQERGPFAVQVLQFAEHTPELGQVTVVDELFAPAAYLDMSDAERLSAPSFEPMAAGVAVGSGYRAPPTAQRYAVNDGSFESIGGLWPEDTSATPDTRSERFAALLHSDPDGWKRRRDQVVVAAAPRFVRAAENSLATVDEAQAWHVIRAHRAADERILPAHAARKVGR